MTSPLSFHLSFCPRAGGGGKKGKGGWGCACGREKRGGRGREVHSFLSSVLLQKEGRRGTEVLGEGADSFLIPPTDGGERKNESFWGTLSPLSRADRTREKRKKKDGQW